MSLGKYLPEWTLTQGGYEEEYTKDGYTVYFASARCHGDDPKPKFMYYVTHDKKVIFTDFFYCDDFKQDRYKVMNEVRDKISQITGMKMEELKEPTEQEEIENIKKSLEYLTVKKHDCNFLKQLQDKENPGRSELTKAIENNDLVSVKYLLNENSGIQNKQAMLGHAMIFGSLDVIKYLVNDYGWELTGIMFTWAIQYNHLHVVKYFIEMQNKLCAEKNIKWKMGNGNPPNYFNINLKDAAHLDFTSLGISFALEKRRFKYPRYKIAKYLFELQIQHYGTILRSSESDYCDYCTNTNLDIRIK